MIRRSAAPSPWPSLAALALAARRRGGRRSALRSDAALECFGRRIGSASLALHHPGGRPPRPALQLRSRPGPRNARTTSSACHEPYAPVRDVRFELPPGLIGDPNVLGAAQQCTALAAQTAEDCRTEVSASGCPNGSQIGIATLYIAGAAAGVYAEPIYMMRPPGGDVVARLGIIAAGLPPSTSTPRCARRATTASTAKSSTPPPQCS